MKILPIATIFQLALITTLSGQFATINSQKINYNFDNEYAVKVSKLYMITIHSEEGARFAPYYDYQDKFKKITSFNMVIRDANGNVVEKYSKSDAYDVAFNSSYEVDDSRMFILEPEYKIYPYSIEVEVKSEHKGYIGFPTWVPRYYFGLEVKNSTLTIENPKGFVVNTKIEGEVGKESTIVLENGNVRTTWYVENLDALENNLKYSEFYDNAPKVIISPKYFAYDDKPGSFESWVSFGNWFYELNHGRNQLSDQTKEEIDMLQITSTSERDLIRLLYEYMQNKTRYVSIQLGIGGFQTLDAAFVDENGYGDCKALTNYMKSMLDHFQIKSNFVLVRAGDDAPNMIKDFPSNQFNHVFLGIPDATDTVFLECTSQNQAFNYLGSFTDDRDVLWIEKDKSSIIRTPKYGFNINKHFIKGSAQILKSGELELNYRTIGTGSFYDEYRRLNHLSEAQIKERSYNFFSYKDFSIIDLEYQKLNSRNAAFKSETSLIVKGLCKSISSRLLVPYNLLDPFNDYVEFDRYKRYAEVENNILINEELEVSLPSGYFFINEPEPVKFASEIGEYSLELTKLGKDSYLVKRDFKLHKAKYTNENFDKFQKFQNSIKLAEQKVIMLRKSGFE